MYLSPAACAAARPPSTSAPDSLASRRLITDTNPSFFSPAMAAGAVAPPHPTVASTREKFVIPGTSAFFTWPNVATDRTRTNVAAMNQGVLMAHIIASIGLPSGFGLRGFRPQAEVTDRPRGCTRERAAEAALKTEARSP